LSSEEKIIALAAKKAFITTKDIQALGFARHQLYQLESKGLLVKVAPGCFTLPASAISEHYELILLAQNYPKMVVSLLSALSFHGITTQNPFQTWISLPKGAWKPSFPNSAVRVSFISEPAYSFGMERHTIDGVEVSIYSVAKTIADCFKFRNQIGLDITLEALKEAHRTQKCTAQELFVAGKMTRTHNVMRPYIEAIL